MEWEKFGNFIVPLVLLFLYFVLGAKKKKEPPEKHEAEPPQKKPPRIREAPLHIPSRVAPAKQVQPPQGRKKNVPSYASKLVKGKSLREAFLLKEILNRPYE